VLSSPLKNPDVFIMAVPDKTTVFAGEGFVVRYYLYKKIQVVNEEIIEFPKLDKFLKRFLKSTARSERVTFNNDIYIRDERYAAKLFASKEGNYSIDPIKYRVQYGVSAHGGPFGNLGIGFGLQNIKSKNLSSKPIKIKVIPLPIENVPKSFTGLVGRHNFKLKLNKSKFLVNEVIETKLVVSGDGALELFEAPKIFNDLAFEEFETKVNLEISPTGFGNKTFDYTYLARKQVDVPGREIPFTYFDPETGQYVTSKVTLDGVTVVGGNIGSGTKGNTQVSKESDTNESEKTKPVEGSQIVAPIFSFNDYNSNTLKQINIGLGILVFLFLGMGLLAPLRKKRNLKNGEATVKKIQANGIQYSDLYNLLILLDGSGQNGRHNFSSLVNTIEHANISNDCKKYFLDLIESCTESNFKTHTDIKFTYNNNYFKEVLDQINVKKKKNKNGNSFESARA